MNVPDGPQGQGELGRVSPQAEVSDMTEILEGSTFMTFQVALALRRIETIMGDNDLAMVTSWREMTFVHSVLSDVYDLLRKVTRYGTANGFTWNRTEREKAARVGQAGELGSGDQCGS